MAMATAMGVGRRDGDSGGCGGCGGGGGGDVYDDGDGDGGGCGGVDDDDDNNDDVSCSMSGASARYFSFVHVAYYEAMCACGVVCIRAFCACICCV